MTACHTTSVSLSFSRLSLPGECAWEQRGPETGLGTSSQAARALLRVLQAACYECLTVVHYSQTTHLPRTAVRVSGSFILPH